MSRRLHSSWAAVLAAAVLVGASACSGNAGDGSSDAAGGSGTEATESGTPAAQSCTGDPVAIRVSAAPEIKDVVAQQAEALGPTVCAKYEVTAEQSGDVAARGPGKDGGPDLWIADSTVWPVQLNTKKADSVEAYSEPIATSPVTLAVPAAIAAQGKVPTGQVPMARQIAGALPALQLAQPSKSASTLMILLTAWTNTGTDRAAQLAAAKAFVPVGHTTATDEQLYERAVPGNSQGPVVFPASEQGMAKFNVAHPDAKITSLGAVEGLAALKYVGVRPSGLDDPVKKADDDLMAALHKAPAADALRAAGFRVDGTGTVSVPGLPQDAKISLDAPAQGTIDEVTTLMTTLGRQVRMLLIVDSSGSMLASSGYGGTRLELAARAVQTALNFVPPNTQAALWQMASNTQFGATDYKVLMPMTRISQEDGTLVPAALQLSNAFDALKPIPDAGTGLYDTISDAYTTTAKNASADTNDIVVLLTDGRNEEDPGSITLEALIDRIKSTKSPDHPVHLALAGLGPQSDMTALRAIAAAAGGTATVVDTQTSLTDVIIGALLQR